MALSSPVFSLSLAKRSSKGHQKVEEGSFQVQRRNLSLCVITTVAHESIMPPCLADWPLGEERCLAGWIINIK